MCPFGFFFFCSVSFFSNIMCTIKIHRKLPLILIYALSEKNLIVLYSTSSVHLSSLSFYLSFFFFISLGFYLLFFLSFIFSFCFSLLLPPPGILPLIRFLSFLLLEVLPLIRLLSLFLYFFFFFLSFVFSLFFYLSSSSSH